MSTAFLTKGDGMIDKKTVSISSKRQITIPQKFFKVLGFADTAECFLRGNELVIRPVSTNTGGEFAEQILRELIDEGYSGEELFEKFKAKQAKIRPAVEALIAEADAVAQGNGEYFTLEEVFAEEEDV